MPLSAERTQEEEAAGSARTLIDRRRHPRFKMMLLGRFMRASKHEYPCKLTDISVGGATLMSPVEVEADEKVVAYFDQLGGLEGKVVRLLDGGFAMSFQVSAHKREKLASQLTWLLNKFEVATLEDRDHERTPVLNKNTMLKLPDGTVIECRVLDVSLSGASIGTALRPAIGSELMFGKLRSQVVRHHDGGIGVRFLDIQEPEAVRRYFG